MIFLSNTSNVPLNVVFDEPVVEFKVKNILNWYGLSYCFADHLLLLYIKS